MSLGTALPQSLDWLCVLAAGTEGISRVVWVSCSAHYIT